VYSSNSSPRFLSYPVQHVRGKRFDRQAIPADARLLPVGVGIYNYDAEERGRSTKGWCGDHRYRPSLAESGSDRQLAYPAGYDQYSRLLLPPTRTGNAYLISTSHALALNGVGQIGDRIFIEGQSPTMAHAPVGRLTAFVPLPLVKEEDQSAPPTRLVSDIAAARLET